MPIEPLDFSGVIPVQFSAQIIEEAVQQSAALTLGNRIPMGTLISEMPVPKAFPKAGWTTAENRRKPYTDLKLTTETMKAEEVAAITAIPDAMLEDSTINLWAWVRPRLAEAIAVAVDNAILFGLDAPQSFPEGGVVAHATAVPEGVDAVDTVNDAMSAVEAGGLIVTGHAADISAKGALRGVRDNSGALLLGTQQVGTASVDTLYGSQIAWSSFEQRDPNFFTGAWQYLMIGVRQDIRYDMNSSAVLADDEGKVVVSGWQDNVTPLKVWARFACVILDPVTVREPDGANPFAVSSLVKAGASTGGGNSGGGNGGSAGAGNGGDGGTVQVAATSAAAPRSSRSKATASA